MKYYYKCPHCSTERKIDWENRETRKECGNCGNGYMPPTVTHNHNAYVDQHDWPKEMEDEVRSLYAKKCIVPWCKKAGETLDHKVPYDPGKTCVNNLQPMCNSHNSSKGRNEYNSWQREIEKDPDLGRK